jgi:hypothetical protein
MFIELMRTCRWLRGDIQRGVAGTGSRFCERKCGEGMMREAEFLKEGLQSVGKAALY